MSPWKDRKNLTEVFPDCFSTKLLLPLGPLFLDVVFVTLPDKLFVVVTKYQTRTS